MARSVELQQAYGHFKARKAPQVYRRSGATKTRRSPRSATHTQRKRVC